MLLLLRVVTATSLDLGITSVLWIFVLVVKLLMRGGFGWHIFCLYNRHRFSRVEGGFVGAWE